MPDNIWYQVNGYYYNPQWAQNWPQVNLQQNAHLQNAFANALAAQAPAQPISADLDPEEGDMINDFKVGCDPEFLILTPQGGTDYANKYFPHYGEIGYDHGGRIAEFRPGPSKGVLPIVKKIQALVAKVKVPGKLRAGAMCNDEPLGGHVHLGFNGFPVRPPAGYGTRNGYALNAKGQEVTKALDALTKTLEHLDILPKNESASRRGGGHGYGAYGDVRDCNGHMEYRTMASWLYDPKVAFLCLTAAKLAAADPTGTQEALRYVSDHPSWTKFKHWLEQYETKDINAKRATEKLLDKGLPFLQVDPNVDFRERWGELGV
jgi:hypothetical protein